MKYLNGPINIVKVSNSTKTLYLFMDFHEEVENQSVCAENEAIDIDAFFSSHLKTASSPIDFFLEVGSSTIKEYKYPSVSNDNYITSLQKWFSRNYHSGYYDKVRFHYMDIREHFDHLPLTDFEFVSLISEFKDVMNDIVELLTKDIKYSKELTNKEKIKRKLVEKIRCKYNDKNLLKVVNNHISTSLVPFIKKSIKYVEKKEDQMIQYNNSLYFDKNHLNTKGYGMDFKDYKKAQMKISIFSNKLFVCWLDSVIVLTDLYFIRRFVDKNYINNAIIYAGSFHCLHIIHLLVKHLGFEVLNTNYSSVSIEELNNLIKKTGDNHSYKMVQWLLPKELYQCSKLPDWFTL